MSAIVILLCKVVLRKHIFSNLLHITGFESDADDQAQTEVEHSEAQSTTNMDKNQANPNSDHDTNPAFDTEDTKGSKREQNTQLETGVSSQNGSV